MAANTSFLTPLISNSPFISCFFSITLLSPYNILLMEAKLDDHTQDGTVDFRGQPALSSNTGKWKACVFLLGDDP